MAEGVDVEDSREGVPADAPTPAALTRRLRDGAVLSRGEVVAVVSRDGDAFNSRVVHLDVQYSPDAPTDAPRALVSKGMDEGWGEREVAFYRDVPEPRDDMLVRCFDATFDAATGASHLLLEDVSVTHAPPVTRAHLLACEGVPAAGRVDAIARALGRFHAHRWEDPRLEDHPLFAVRPWFSDRDAFAAHVTRREGELAAAEPALREADPTALDRYRGALARLPAIFERHLETRIAARRRLTLGHGDCYWTQWLCPRSGAGSPLLVDFDSASGLVGAFDLVFLLATFWTAEQRAAHEHRALRAYLGGLADAGVRLEWDDLVLDYRVMLSFVLFDAVFDIANGSPASYWAPKMRCLSAAFDEWECARLA